MKTFIRSETVKFLGTLGLLMFVRATGCRNTSVVAECYVVVVVRERGNGDSCVVELKELHLGLGSEPRHIHELYQATRDASSTYIRK